jgi:hypothetical protein
VLEKTLLIEHRACREGALHGLGEITRTQRGLVMSWGAFWQTLRWTLS